LTIAATALGCREPASPEAEASEGAHSDGAPRWYGDAGSVAYAGDANAEAGGDDAGYSGSAAQAVLAPGPYLVAMDTPTRTYLDYVELPDGGSWQPAVDGMPQLAQWENVKTVTATRFQAFNPGDVLSKAAIMALLPATAPASRSFDITAAPYDAHPSPADATSAIQAALDAAAKVATAQQPVDVVVPAGNYVYTNVLNVAAHVRLRGTGGVLHGTTQEASAVHLAGDGSGALFLTLQMAGSARGTKVGASGIWVGASSAPATLVHDTLVVGNEVIQPSGAHVFALGEEGGLWAFNYVHDGFADGYHHTGSSSYCQVVGNRASMSASRGDDFYAFVGYASDGDPVHHCSCIANAGQDGPARGLAAVGGAYIDFQDNVVQRTQMAGVYVASESSYMTFGSFSVIVLRDRITDANLGGSHDGLLAFADDPTTTHPSKTFGTVPNEIRSLSVQDNTITDTSAGAGNGYGIEVRTSCVGGTVVDNDVTHAVAPGIVVRGTGFTVSANTFVAQ
jgi:hypothetical protein